MLIGAVSAIQISRDEIDSCEKKYCSVKKPIFASKFGTSTLECLAFEEFSEDYLFIQTNLRIRWSDSIEEIWVWDGIWRKVKTEDEKSFVKRSHHWVQLKSGDGRLFIILGRMKNLIVKCGGIQVLSKDQTTKIPRTTNHPTKFRTSTRVTSTMRVLTSTSLSFTTSFQTSTEPTFITKSHTTTRNPNQARKGKSDFRFLSFLIFLLIFPLLYFRTKIYLFFCWVLIRIRGKFNPICQYPNLLETNSELDNL
jgi:hypothetical protein